MKKIVLILIIFIAIQVSSCDKENLSERQELFFTDSKKASGLIEADTKFGFDLFRQMLEMKEAPENIMISPLSVAMALGMTYNGAEGETKTAFEETLRLNGITRQEINDIHKTLLFYLLSADPDVDLDIANSIWYRKDFNVLQSFIESNRIHYQAEVRSLDFSKPEAKDIINGWVSAKTHNKVNGIIDNISAETVMFLINAIYFHGTWTYSFEKGSTYLSDFTKEDQSVEQVSYMLMKGRMNYLTNDIFSAIELPYGNENFSMVFILPGDGKSISDIAASMNINNYMALTDGFIKKEINIHLPKFKFGYKELLNQPLADMGLSIAFSGLADFTGINPDGGLYISKVIHQSFIDVNEKGTEAAAATVVQIDRTSIAPEITVFKADKPFLFFIREKSSNAVLFLGKVGHPVYN